MSNRIDHGNHAAEAHLQAQTAQQHHTQQTVKSQKLQHTKMQLLRVRHNLMQAKFALNKKWAHNHAAAARGALAQKVMARFGSKPTPKAATGKGAGLRAKDREKDLHGKELPHDKEVEKDLHEQQMPREREPQVQKEREKDREKDRQPQQDQRQPDREKQQNKERQPDRERQQDKERQQERQPDRERQKDGDSQQNRNGNGGNGDGGQQQQQQQPQQQSQQQSQQQPQQEGQQQQRQQKQREGKEREGGGSKFAVTSRKISTPVKVPENFQALGAKLGNARATDTHRVLLQTFAKVVLRHAAQLDGGFALAPLMVLNATSPGAIKRNQARMQSQIASAMFNLQRAASAGTAPGKASAGVGILSHSLDLTMARQRFGVGYSIDDQSMLSVRQLMIDVKASMPTLAASNGVATASDKSPEVRVAAAAPGSQT